MTSEEILRYKPLALEALRNHTVGYQVGWYNICKEINLPETYWEDFKNIFVHEGYINVEIILQEGDIVRSNPKVTVDLLMLSNSPLEDSPILIAKKALKSQIEKLSYLNATNYQHWQIQTASIIKKYFGENSPEYDHTSGESLLVFIPPIYVGDSDIPGQLNRNIPIVSNFLNTCIETIEHVGVYKGVGNTTTPSIKFDYSTHTHGDNSPIAGRDLQARDFKKEENKESEDYKEINRQGLRISKKTLSWTIAGVILVLIIALWSWLIKALASLF